MFYIIRGRKKERRERSIGWRVVSEINPSQRGPCVIVHVVDTSARSSVLYSSHLLSQTDKLSVPPSSLSLSLSKIAMSILLRALPIISIRSKRLSLSPLPLLYLNFQTLNKPNTCPISRRTNHSASALPTPFTSPGKTLSSTPKLPETPFQEWVSRTGLCGELSESDVGNRVRLCGWVALHRVHGGLTFLNLRDHTGLVQVYKMKRIPFDVLLSIILCHEFWVIVSIFRVLKRLSQLESNGQKVMSLLFYITINFKKK